MERFRASPPLAIFAAGMATAIILLALILDLSLIPKLVAGALGVISAFFALLSGRK